ncbi:MAG: MBL fold metallo-hydrolase [Clostridia bacterium]|nr:MBL fold metallo-hydrolase [Clostridia bacterium]
MKLTNLGQCGFVIETGGAKLVTDPYLSYTVDENHYSEATPWVRLYAPPCALIDAAPDVVVISHSHDDHMDPKTLGDYRAAGGDCVIAAPAPECGKLEELGFSNIVYARAEQAFEAKGFKVTPIICAHTEPHVDDRGSFRELSYIIEAEGKKLLFGGDLSIYDGLVERVARENIDYALIPANGRDDERTANDIIGNTDAAEAAYLAAAWDCVLVPTHYDLYAINGCPAEEIIAAAEKAGAKILMPGVGETVEI